MADLDVIREQIKDINVKVLFQESGVDRFVIMRIKKGIEPTLKHFEQLKAYFAARDKRIQAARES